VVVENVTGTITDMTFSSDGAFIAAVSEYYTIRVWDTATGQLLRTLSRENERAGYVAFDPTGSSIESGIASVWTGSSDTS